MRPVGIAVLGCGVISDIYLQNITRRFGAEITIQGVCDLNREAAQKRQLTYGLPQIYDSYEALLADPAVELVVNLSAPAGHYPLTKQALLAGKHVYSEKPLATGFTEAAELMKLAKEKGLRIGCAPDVPLGAAQQTCRRIIDSGEIGRPIGFSANLVKVPAVESWHPNPGFYYSSGGGPLWDMGPYYLSAIIHMLGPISRVSGVNGRHFTHRTITSEPRRGEVIPVEVDTTCLSLIEMESGAIGNFTTTFDYRRARLPFLEIYGTNGTLSVPDPNVFAGTIEWFSCENDAWQELPARFAYAENSRGLGVAEMACALRENRPHRANADIALHVAEAMAGIEESSQNRCSYIMQTHCQKPAPMREDGGSGR